MPTYRIINNDVLEGLRTLPDESIQCCVTSPPYWGLRDYGSEGQIGAEAEPNEYVEKLVAVFNALKRPLRKNGTLWLNLGDTYAANRSYQVPSTKGGPKHAPAQGFKGSAMRVPSGLKSKDLIGIPWLVAFALQKDGWYLRSSIIWEKPNAMPESSTDRPNRCFENIFLLSTSERYHYDHLSVKQPTADGKMRNLRNIWSINTQPSKGTHFATFPTALVEPCVLAGCPSDGVVLDPFAGSGTVGVVAMQHGRNFVGIELNAEYAAMADRRIMASVTKLAA